MRLEPLFFSIAVFLVCAAVTTIVGAVALVVREYGWLIFVPAVVIGIGTAALSWNWRERVHRI